MLWLKRAFAAACACGALLWGGPARAQDRVLLLDTPAAPRAGLGTALRIQLMDQVEVDVLHELPDGSVSERIAAATAKAEQHGSLLVVWSDEPLAQPDGSSEVILYAVSRQQGRALLQVVRVPGGTGPEADRALALKVGEVIRELQRARELASEAALLQLEPPPSPTPGGAAWQAAPVLSLGLVFAPQAGTAAGHWGVTAGGGASLTREGLRLSASLQLTGFPSVTAERAADSVELTQWAPELLIRSQWLQGPCWLGAHAGVGVVWFELQARTRSGRESNTSVTSAAWLLGLDLEWPAREVITLALAASLEARSSARRLSVNGTEVTAIDRVRPRMVLSVQVRP